MAYNKFFLGSILVWMACMIPMSISAAALSLSWNSNTEADLAGYMVYYGNTSGIYTSSEDAGKVTSYDISNVTNGKTYYITLRAYDTSGNESACSQEVYAYIPVPNKTPSIQLLNPIAGAVLSIPTPTLSWSATTLTTFTLYMALNNGSYNKMYSGTNTSHRLAPFLWYLFIPSGSTIKWYVVGSGSSGQQVSSVVSYFKKL